MGNGHSKSYRRTSSGSHGSLHDFEDSLCATTSPAALPPPVVPDEPGEAWPNIANYPGQQRRRESTYETAKSSSLPRTIPAHLPPDMDVFVDACECVELRSVSPRPQSDSPEEEPLRDEYKKQPATQVSGPSGPHPGYQRSSERSISQSHLAFLPTTRDERPSTTRDERPSTTRDERPSTTRDERPSTTRDERPSTTRDERPSTTRDNRPPTTRDDRPPTTRDDRPPTTSDDRPPTTSDDRLPTTRDNQRLPSMGSRTPQSLHVVDLPDQTSSAWQPGTLGTSHRLQFGANLTADILKNRILLSEGTSPTDQKRVEPEFPSRKHYPTVLPTSLKLRKKKSKEDPQSATRPRAQPQRNQTAEPNKTTEKKPNKKLVACKMQQQGQNGKLPSHTAKPDLTQQQQQQQQQGKDPAEVHSNPQTPDVPTIPQKQQDDKQLPVVSGKQLTAQMLQQHQQHQQQLQRTNQSTPQNKSMALIDQWIARDTPLTRVESSIHTDAHGMQFNNKPRASRKLPENVNGSTKAPTQTNGRSLHQNTASTSNNRDHKNTKPRSRANSRPVKLANFPEHFRVMSADSDFRFSEEYDELKSVGREQLCTAADLPCNRGKNRFTNILPYDHSRVKLLPVDDDEGSDYINANYMPGENSPREFIVTQGPLPSTRDDFWRMIWEQNCRCIVMLTRCIEKGREKCDHYWPHDTEPVFYGDLQVAILNESKYPDWNITEFKISMGDYSRVIRHFHFTTWPDFVVPEHPQTLIKFVRAVREKVSYETKPIIVHCSAGVGRSGTWICLDRLLQQVKKHDMADIFGMVHDMRRERVWMVQTEQQYVFIHACLLAVIEGKEDQPYIQGDREGEDNKGFEER